MEHTFSHISVLLSETIDALAIKPDGFYVDCTTGGGGHSYAIASRLSGNGHLLCLDRDADALAAASERLAPFRDRIRFVKDNFLNLASHLEGEAPDGILMDLGVSSYQLDTPERGFSYMNDAPLDMRMSQDAPLSAFDVVNSYSEEQLADVIFRYGEERFSRRIAAQIVKARESEPIRTTGQLAELVSRSIPQKPSEKGSHPEKRTFQAIRIEVNGELDVIEPAIRTGVQALKAGGRLAVITFHSLEDRLVKQTFAELEKGCTCPPDFPVCVCGRKPVIRSVFRKPVLPSEEEMAANVRSHSAKLRAAEKL